MDKYIFDEKNGLWYELQGDYYLPCLKLPDEEQQPFGVWGAGVRWTPLPKAEEPTESADETSGTGNI